MDSIYIYTLEFKKYNLRQRIYTIWRARAEKNPEIRHKWIRK
jgi:hypothetical protein